MHIDSVAKHGHLASFIILPAVLEVQNLVASVNNICPYIDTYIYTKDCN